MTPRRSSALPRRRGWPTCGISRDSLTTTASDGRTTRSTWASSAGSTTTPGWSSKSIRRTSGRRSRSAGEAQTGFALVLDRLVMSAEAERTIEPPRPLDAYVVPVGDGSRKKAIQILTSLRAAGLGADIDLIGRGPSKNLDYANAIGARFAVILGERELKQGRATLREMANGVQREIAIEDLVDAVRRV